MNFKSKYLHIGLGVALGTLIASIDTNMLWYISALKVITTTFMTVLFLLLWDKYKASRQENAH